jgi:excisionase family DNA binding protein
VSERIDTPLLTARQAADRLSVHRNTLRRMLDDGEIPFYRINSRGDIRIAPSAIDRWLRENRGVTE